MKITTIEEADKVTPEWIRANVDHDTARAIDQDRQYSPMNNVETPAVFTMPALGTWRCDEMGEYSVLVSVPVNEMVAAEGEWDIALQYSSTQKYIEWQRAGLMPPPLDVIRQAGGRLVSLNRRRWLAAREAGTKELYCWYSPTHAEHSSRSAYWLPERSEYYRAEIERAVSRGMALTDYFSKYVLSCFGIAC